MTLQRWQFPPTEAYAMARELLSFGEEDGHEKEHFVLTSNVDGCFERSGFSNIYTPQGDWSHYQCMGQDWSGPCRSDAVWPSKEHVDRAFASLDESTGCV